MDLGIQLSKEVAFTASGPGTTPIPCPMAQNPGPSSSMMDFRFSQTVSADATHSQKKGYIGGKFSMNNNGKSANQIPLSSIRKTSSMKKDIGVISERLLEMSGLWIDGVKNVQHRTRNSSTLPLDGAGPRVVQPAGRSDRPAPSHSAPSPGPSHTPPAASHSTTSPGSSPPPPASSSVPHTGPPPTPSNLRPIVLDGSNICLALGKGEDFLTEGLHIVYDWFARRGHEVLIILPQSRKSKLPISWDLLKTCPGQPSCLEISVRLPP